MILSHIQTRPLLYARKQGRASAETSLDLGMTSTTAILSAEGVQFANGEYLPWASIETINHDIVKCYSVNAGGELQPVQIFSQVTNRLCSLFPTTGAPSMLIAGFVMHRIKDIGPIQHAQRMISTLTPISGQVLDTTTGLGYTAMLAARTAEHVTAIELDPAVQEIARLNPWSRDLFDNPKIEQLIGDAYEVVTAFENERFDRILHDPPMFKLAGELYSGAFYHELHRILKRGGRLFHYVGDPTSKVSGNITAGVLRRLNEADFSRVVRRPEAYGVVAYK